MKKIAAKASIFLIMLFVGALTVPTVQSAGVEVVRVGYIEGFGFVNDISSINHKGYGYDLLKHIERNTNYSFEYVPLTFQDIEASPFEKVDVLAGFAETPEREGLFNFIEPEIGYSQMALVARPEDISNLYYDDTDTINGKTVSTYPGNIANQQLNEYLFQRSISVSYVYSDEQNYLNAEADLFLAGSQAYNGNDFISVLNFDQYPIKLAVAEQNTALADRLSRTIQQIMVTDKEIINQIYEKYDEISPQTTTRTITKIEAELLSLEKWSVGYSEDHRPYQYTNSDGEADGIAVRVIKGLAEKYNFELEFIPIDEDAEKLDPAQFDLIISMMGDIEDVSSNFTATNPSYDYPIVFVSEKNVFEPEQKGTVGILNLLAFDYTRFQKDYPELTLVKYDDLDKLLDDNESGAIDGAILTELGFQYKIKKDGAEYGSYEYTTDFFLPKMYFVSNNLRSEYVDIINLLIQTIDENELYSITLDEQDKYLPTNIFEIFLEYLWLLIIVTVLVLAFYITSKVHSLHKNKRRMQKIIDTDSLTGLDSMHKFSELAKKMLLVPEQQFEVISIDIDYFRTINTYSGMEKGDAIIKAMAKSLKEGYANVEAIISRVTAEQFVILHRNFEGEDIRRICENRILPEIKEIMGKNYNISLSIGNYVVEDANDPINVLIDRANLARLSGKQLHKTTYNTFTKDKKERYEKMANITFRMEKALIDREFYVVYQPRVDLETFELCGAEALVRWKPLYGDVIKPGDFIPIFEKNGFIADLDIYVFEEVCNFIKDKSRFRELPVISVNLSSFTLVHEKAVGNLIKIAKKYDIKPRQIEIEIAENLLVEFDSTMETRINQLRVFGFKLSIDDFGEGASSLNHLTNFNANIVKLDKAFLDKAGNDIGEYTVVRNIINLVHDLKMKAVCEGVENVEQAKILKEIGCDYAQGYFFDKPLESDEFKKALIAYKRYSVE